MKIKPWFKSCILIFFGLIFMGGNIYSKGVKGLELISSGALILPMDNAHQGVSGKFNLKAYGLIVHLLENHIPVKRIIKEGKSNIEAIDLIAASRQIKPSISSSSVNEFRAGPFVVEKEFAESALKIISAFDNSVRVYELTMGVNAHVSYSLTIPPKVAILSDEGFKSQHENILKAAKITTYKVISATELKSSDCYTLVSIPNWKNGKTVPLSIASNVKNYVESGGSFFAENWAVVYFEAICRFQTVGGKGFNQTGNISEVSYRNASHPIIQLDGNIFNEKDDFSSYGPDNSALKIHVVELIKDPNVRKYKVTVKNSSSISKGMVVYSVTSQRIESAELINSARLYLNAILFSSQRPSQCSSFADLKLSFHDLKKSGCENQLYKTKIAVTNLGNIPSANIVIKTVKASELHLKDYSLSTGLLDLLKLEWRISILQPGKSDTITMSFIPPSDESTTGIKTYIQKSLMDHNQLNDTIHITYNRNFPAVAALPKEQTVCSGFSTVIGVEDNSSFTYKWTSKPAGFNSSIAKPTVSPKVNTYYILALKDENNGCEIKDSIFVKIINPPSKSYAGKDTSQYTRSIQLKGNMPVVGVGEWKILEGKGSIRDPNDPRTEVTGLGGGKNIFQWSISNLPCETSSSDVEIDVLELIIPTSFTPNGDGVNDNFIIEGIENFPDNVVQIFNRWGNTVFKQSGYLNTWNGKASNGKELTDDTYFCSVEVDGVIVHKKYLIIKR